MDNAEVIVVCAKIEEEMAELEDDDKAMFLEELGIKESGLDLLIRATYSLLGYATYFTAGVQEVRAWTFRKGMKAPQCAAIIHTDFETRLHPCRNSWVCRFSRSWFNGCSKRSRKSSSRRERVYRSRRRCNPIPFQRINKESILEAAGIRH